MFKKIYLIIKKIGLLVSLYCRYNIILREMSYVKTSRTIGRCQKISLKTDNVRLLIYPDNYEWEIFIKADYNTFSFIPKGITHNDNLQKTEKEFENTIKKYLEVAKYIKENY